MENDKHIRVEVAYALPDKQVILPLEVPEGTAIEEAIKRSGILEQFPEIELDTAKTGIFGKINKLNKVLRDKDRIEIYRPLIADPKESRRQQAEMQKKNAEKNNKS